MHSNIVTIFSLSSDYYFSLYGSDLSQYVFDYETPQKIEPYAALKEFR